MNASQSSLTSEVQANDSWRPPRGGYLTALGASFGHAGTAMLRQQQIILAALIAFLPVLLPLFVAFMSTSKFAESGSETFVFLVENLHVNVLAPLLALFFATMLVGEDFEAQTISYVLTRPVPRSAWVLGRFLAYVVIVSVILMVSVMLTFGASLTLEGLTVSRSNLWLVAHYGGVILLGVLSYGAFMTFLGAISRRPIIIGMVAIFAWQKLAVLVPGLIDFFTICKYTDAILPRMATARGNETIKTALGEFQKKVFLVGATKAIVTLCLITVLFLGLTVVTVRVREYAKAHAAGG